jgi:hypothetical protein
MKANVNAPNNPARAEKNTQSTLAVIKSRIALKRHKLDAYSSTSLIIAVDYLVMSISQAELRKMI